MPRLQARNFAAADDVRDMAGVHFEVVTLEEATVGRCRFPPGWRWSTSFGPILGQASCPIRHLGYSVSGSIRVVMNDGQSIDLEAGSVFDIPPGHDKWVLGDEPWETIEWGGSGRAVAAALQDTGARTFATVLFTDIVGSTSTAGRLGDQAWRQQLVDHNARLRMQLNVFRGREVKTTGDGILAVFDSPTRAVRCAAEIVRATQSTDIAVRIGIHTGEVELSGDDVSGIAVHVAARVLGLGDANEVMVSSTTRDLVEGSGLVLEAAGAHELKGLSGTRHVFRLVVDDVARPEAIATGPQPGRRRAGADGGATEG
jgi:class 3 adenylate cyclase